MKLRSTLIAAVGLVFVLVLAPLPVTAADTPSSPEGDPPPPETVDETPSPPTLETVDDVAAFLADHGLGLWESSPGSGSWWASYYWRDDVNPNLTGCEAVPVKKQVTVSVNADGLRLRQRLTHGCDASFQATAPMTPHYLWRDVVLTDATNPIPAPTGARDDPTRWRRTPLVDYVICPLDGTDTANLDFPPSVVYNPAHWTDAVANKYNWAPYESPRTNSRGEIVDAYGNPLYIRQLVNGRWEEVENPVAGPAESEPRI